MAVRRCTAFRNKSYSIRTTSSLWGPTISGRTTFKVFTPSKINPIPATSVSWSTTVLRSTFFMVRPRYSQPIGTAAKFRVMTAPFPVWSLGRGPLIRTTPVLRSFTFIYSAATSIVPPLGEWYTVWTAAVPWFITSRLWTASIVFSPGKRAAILTTAVFRYSAVSCITPFLFLPTSRRGPIRTTAISRSLTITFRTSEPLWTWLKIRI